ncbi:virulence-associated E family protein [Sedimenticola selenatireducens]|uniref:Virulence-associated protein E-like domain-containing protein n=1 Tax=Sedimenticola selenatireducens TaxID=191960 RepID=A0A558E116_9GAMM|nr:virulence-associated E family protein [Sedimenticola selenatireducens]TVO75123.1 hypothetical protein FHP88_08910 [Sedimenticola selenatireducens]TVT67022.1 MAG: hypothetical protein FHK78_01445 [Sedimenticola selenatireducens]
MTQPADKNKQKRASDFNDLHLIAGLDVVAQQINSALADAQRSLDRGITQNSPEYEPSTLPPEPPIEAYVDDAAQPGWMNPKEFGWYARLDTTEKGQIRPHAANLERILASDPRWSGVLAYDDFSYRLIKLKTPPMPHSAAGEWEDADTSRLRIWLHRNYFMMPPPKTELQDALITVAQANRYHPVRSYLQKLRWDGEKRIGAWLTSVFRAGGDTRYLRAAGGKFLIMCVARVMVPGCKADNVMILEGGQGWGKSTAIGALFGEWFSDSPIPIGEKDAYSNIQGVWGYELAELDSFNKAESTAAKAFFSQRRDRYRPPYGSTSQDFPRQTVFIGSTNQEEYLKDYSGNRRYWPIRCLAVDVAWVTANRDQLWAEALDCFSRGVPWWVSDPAERELFEREQDTRLQRDPWEDRLRDFLGGNTTQYFTAEELLSQAIEKPVGTQTRADMNRIAPIMMSLGWHKARKSLQGKGRHWVYLRPVEDDSPDLPEGEDE